jgi:ABC-2 type transport system ATP-binding protein
MSNVAVHIKDVTKVIKDRTIVDKLSLDINQGEIFGLLGPNGAGKTTTIRLMVGLMGITEGDILIRNKSITKNFKEAVAHIGAIVENPELYPFLSGYLNLVHFANMFPKITKERIHEVVSLVGLENRIHDKVKTYSLGMRQRLGLAQAILHKPSVLILDEPTNGLDPAGIKELRSYLRNLVDNEGVAVIVSSHLLAEMELMCDRFAIIQNGKLISVEDKGQYALSSENKVSFELDNPTRGITELQKHFPDLEFTVDKDTISVYTNRETTAKINSYLVSLNILVYRIEVRHKSLEDIFMEMTGGGTID